MSAMNHALIELQEAAGADSLHPPEKGRAVGPGFVAVPVEPTPEMLREATNSVRQFSADRAATVYSAMLRAAPTTILSQCPDADAEAIKAFKDRFPPPPNPQAPTMKERT